MLVQHHVPSCLFLSGHACLLLAMAVDVHVVNRRRTSICKASDREMFCRTWQDNSKRVAIGEQVAYLAAS